MTLFAALRRPARSAWALTAGLVDLLLPPRCPACASVVGPSQLFCAVCEVGLLEPHDPCPRCGEPEALELCARCQQDTPSFAALRAALLYGGPLADALLRFKYQGRSELARPLAALLTTSPLVARASWPAEIDVLVPVPLHARRLRERGYNQAALLARPLARLLRRPLACRLLERQRETRTQASLGLAERRENVQGAFVVRAPARPLLSARRVLLVDDVATSGATAEACARALLAGGASRVHVLVLARAVAQSRSSRRGSP